MEPNSTEVNHNACDEVKICKSSPINVIERNGLISIERYYPNESRDLAESEAFSDALLLEYSSLMRAAAELVEENYLLRDRLDMLGVHYPTL